MKNLLNKGLGIVAAIVSPFLAVLTVGLLFDEKTGGDPFYATFATLFFFSPLWLLLGIGFAISGFRNERLRFRLLAADGILLGVICCAVAVVRNLNEL